MLLIYYLWAETMPMSELKTPCFLYFKVTRKERGGENSGIPVLEWLYVPSSSQPSISLELVVDLTYFWLTHSSEEVDRGTIKYFHISHIGTFSSDDYIPSNKHQ